FQAEATGAGITFEAIWNDPLPSLTTDPNHLSRILEELLTNACKYTPPGNLIRLRVCHDRENIFVYVFNSGVTIPQEEHQRIFDRFYRIPNRDPWKYPGTGLGLSLVKKLVELLGGQIWLRTGPAWVEFGVQLPLSPA
ncbi:MAG: ATP-binding protein, partial [Thermostichales cyanobacterium DRC_bins_46]